MISIRNLTKKHQKELEKVYVETIMQGFPEYSSKTLKHLVEKKFRTKVLKLPIKLGAFNGKELIGYLLAEKPVGGVIYISWLAVIKSQQKKRIGTKLLKSFEKIALKNGAHNVQFDSNERNLDFYKSKGYGVIGLDKKSYYGIDSFIVKKIIQEPKEENFLK